MSRDDPDSDAAERDVPDKPTDGESSSGREAPTWTEGRVPAESDDARAFVSETALPGGDAATLPPDGRSAEVVDSSSSPRCFGDFELLEEIARGGMGVVYKARQVSLGRIVALKMILAGQLASAEEIKRFHTEAEAAANLDHPGIVPVYGVGDHQGQHFFSMGFVDGRSLADRLTSGPMAPREAVPIVIGVARAVAYAHQHGVIHRDIKPANVLLDSQGEPRVTDFGLAKRIEADERLTSTGQILGTPGYMAPEQAAGRTAEIGVGADIYAIGALLYATLTGRPPFQADNPLDTILQVLEKAPVPIRLLNPKVDPDLETVCLKCLEKNPEDRYTSVETLLDDLGRYHEGESISVKSLNLVDRLVRTLRRSKQDAELRTWGTMLYWFSLIVFLAEVGIYVHAWNGPPYPKEWAIAIRATQYISMGLVLWRYRKRWSISTGAAERQMLSIWVGFFLACHVALAAAYVLATPDRPMDELQLYPSLAIVSGLTYFVMGSSYWGQCYTMAIAFFAGALLMAVHLPWAPLEFGALWAVSLAVIGTRLRRLATPDD